MEAAKLTVLGASPAWTNPGGAGSGYLLRRGGTAIQIEAGSGTFGRLRKVIPVDQLTAVLISHVHGDHFLDLVPLCYGLRYANLRSDAPLTVLVPTGCIEFLRSFGEALNGEPNFFSDTFDLCEYKPNAPFEIDGIVVEAHPLQHYIPSFALRFDIGPGFVFSGDTGPCEELVEAARGAGTLLCESALTDAAQDAQDPKERGHLLPAEAASIAERADVQHLMLTHFRTDIQSPEDVVAKARPHFSGRLTVVRELRTYSL